LSAATHASVSWTMPGPRHSPTTQQSNHNRQPAANRATSADLRLSIDRRALLRRERLAVVWRSLLHLTAGVRLQSRPKMSR
jgi:hypothetical protein